MAESEPTTPNCVCPDGCGSPAECRAVELCLGSDEGVAFQEQSMRMFFEWVFGDSADAE